MEKKKADRQFFCRRNFGGGNGRRFISSFSIFHNAKSENYPSAPFESLVLFRKT